jgi:RNA polymerase sigma-70 factor (ECF subfamily)
MPTEFSARLQHLLALVQADHDSARNPLLQFALERFRQLAHRMFHRHDDLRALYDTDDVLQQALVRLNRALSEIKPGELRALFSLMARQIRWVLLDLARKNGAAKAVEYNQSRAEENAPRDPDGEPGDLLEWTSFHEAIENLPAESREMFDLLFYEGLSQTEAAEILRVTTRTVKRRWQSARLLLQAALHGDRPPLG